MQCQGLATATEPGPDVETRLLQLSAATMDRMRAEARERTHSPRKRRSGVGAAIRRSIPVRAFADWRGPPPGSFEVDRVEHCGLVKAGADFVRSLVLTDIASGWAGCLAMPETHQTTTIARVASPRATS